MSGEMNYSNVSSIYLTKEEVLHLILKHKWYNAIDSGTKKIEYRDNTEYWRKRILGKKYVTFHKGYTNVIMTFKIDKIELDNETINIHLGDSL